MKNRNIVYLRDNARIYRQYYQPSFNLFRLMKSVLGVFLSGSSPASGSITRKK